MIDYVEVRNNETELISIIDAFQSVIWHSIYFGVGDFEVYTEATPEAVETLVKGNYITRPDDIEIGIIENVNIVNDIQGGKMISATGRFSKSILDRRLIYNLSGNSNKATVLRGNVEEKARQLVYDNAIDCPFNSKRNIAILELGELAGIPARIVNAKGYATQKQVSYQNLLEYSDSFLEEYGLASIVVLNPDRKKLLYVVYNGIDRSANNTDGNTPIVFSQEFDNLISSEYSYITTAEKNAALIGGAGEGVARFYSTIEGEETDLDRREMFIDASGINRTYTDENEVEQTYTDEDYTEMIQAKGAQDIAPLKAVESFAGVIDIVNGNWIYNRDFALGDIVTVQDNSIGKYINVRITEITEVQDENGYTVEAAYKS